MSACAEFYQETARCLRFTGNGRLEHKLAGVHRFQPRAEPPHETWIAAAEDAAWRLIYDWHYLGRRRVEADSARPQSLREREDAEFVSSLAASDCSPGVFETGWRVVSQDDCCICEKDGIRLRVPVAAACGEVIAVRFPAGRRYWMPDYYCTGAGSLAETDVRIYCNVKPDWAPWLLRAVSRSLTQYQFKLLNHPRSYTRPDAAVLYVDREGVDAALGLLCQLTSSGAPAFRSRTPPMTLPLAPGIALADEPPLTPGRRMSFGEHRCRLLARALAWAYATSGTALESIQREFTRAGLDAGRPHAAAGSGGVADSLKLRYHQTGA